MGGGEREERTYWRNVNKKERERERERSNRLQFGLKVFENSITNHKSVFCNIFFVAIRSTISLHGCEISIRIGMHLSMIVSQHPIRRWVGNLNAGNPSIHNKRSEFVDWIDNVELKGENVRNRLWYQSLRGDLRTHLRMISFTREESSSPDIKLVLRKDFRPCVSVFLWRNESPAYFEMSW